MTLLAFGELGGDEFRGAALRHFLVEAGDQLVVELDVAEQNTATRAARCGWSCPPWPGESIRRPSAWRGRPSIPCPTGNRASPRRRTRPTPSACREAETKDRCRSPAPATAAVAAGRDYRHALGLGRHPRRIKLAAGKLEQDADDLVLHQRQPLGAAPAMAIPEQAAPRRGARACMSAVLSRWAMAVRNSRSRPAWRSASALRSAASTAGVDQFTRGARRSLNVQHYG